MALQKIRVLPITGYVLNRTELVDIPSDQPIKELRFDVELATTDDTVADAITFTGDPFLLMFQYIEILFDGDRQYRIDSLAKLQALSILYTGKKAEVEVYHNSNSTTASGNVKASFRIPVMWTPTSGVMKPQVRFQYTSTSWATPGSNLMRIQYVQTADTSMFKRFKLDAVAQTSSSGGTLQFRPDNGAVVRGAFVFNKDISATYSSGGELSISQLGGLNGLAEITLTHKGVDYWNDASEKDILHDMYNIFPLIPKVGLTDSLSVERELWGDSPFVYYFESVDDSTADEQTNLISQFSGLNPFLYVSLEDITADVNTLLKTVSDAGTYGAGDECEVWWVYSQKASDEKAK